MRKFLKITGIVLCTFILLVLAAFIFLNTEPGQNFVRGRLEVYLRSKLKTEVRIGRLGYSLPKYIVLENTLFLDQSRDTLLSVGNMKVDLDMMQLFKRKVDVQQILVRNLRSHIYRRAPGTDYNFTYIITAFGGNTKGRNVKGASPLSFHLDRLKLDNIHFRLDDETAGMALASDLDHLDLRMSAFNINDMNFHVKDLNVAGLRSTFVQDTSYLPPTVKDTSKMKLVADNVNLNNIVFRYNNNLNKFLFDMNMGTLQLQLKEYNRTRNSVDVDKLVMANTTGVLKIGKSSTPPAPVDTIVKIDTTEGWYVNAKTIDLKGINFKMDNENEPKLKYGMDYNHLDVRKLSLSLDDLSYNSDTVLGDLKHFAVVEQSGLKVDEFKTVFNYSSTGVILRKLYLHTPQTTLQSYVEVHYPSLAILKKRMESMQVNVNLQNSYVGVRDLSLFIPAIQRQAMFRKFANQRMQVDARVTGYVNNLNVAKLYLKGLSNTELSVNGTLKGLPDPRYVNYNLHIGSFKSSRQDLALILPPSSVSAIRIPDRFGVMGQLAGTAYNYNGSLVIVSTDGYATLKGSLSVPPGRGIMRYDVVAHTRQLNIGRIFKIDSLKGPVTANIDIKGQGSDPKTMSADFDVDIESAYVMRYRYHDVSLKGRIDAQRVNADIVSNDENARLRGNVEADLSAQYPAVKADVHIDSIDMQALRLVSTQFRARGTIHADIPILNPDYPDGELIWKQPMVATGGNTYKLDSIYMRSKPTADHSQNIYANLDVLQTHITGHMPLTKVGPIITDQINKHYAELPVKDGSANTGGPKDFRLALNKPLKPVAIGKGVAPPEYDLQFTAVAYDKPILHGLLPGLTSFDSIHADGSLTEHDLVFNANVPQLVYNDIAIKKATAQLRGVDSALTYNVEAEQISSFKVGVWYAKVRGSVNRNLITTDISLSDSLKKERFALKADMHPSGGAQIINLENGLKLNYDVWNVTQPNQIVLTDKGVYVQNLTISNGGQSITASSTQQQANSPLRIDFNNFELASITRTLSLDDTLAATGAVNGNVIIERMSPALQMTGDMTVQNFALYGDTLGMVHASARNRDETAIDIKANLTGRGNDVSVNGEYLLKPVDGNALDLNVALNPLAVRNIEGLVSHQIRNTSGYLRGNLRIQGGLTDPHITGQLKTDNLRTTVVALGTEYIMPAETIDFYQYQMVFHDFKLQDSAGNKAYINGSIATVEWSNLDFNLTLKAKNWRALGSKTKDNDMFYGNLYVDADMQIKGTSANPSVDGSIHVLKNTNFTIINPQQNSESASSKGVVAFVNHKDSTHYLVAVQDTTARRKFSAGSGVNVSIIVDKEAAFNLIVDEASGDFVSIHGEANIIAAVRPGGAIDVTGAFTVASGFYQFNYNFIKRKFVIQKGSTVTFGGDIYKSTILDVTAIYETHASAYDLVSRQVPDPAELNYYRQGLPFQVIAHMKGNMQQPAFTFDVVLPENKVYPLTADKIDLIQAKLSQMRGDTSELNKQVFAILILNRFVSDDPFSSGATTTLTSTAVQSISTFVGEQLNQMAGRLIQGVDLTVDIASTDDYTTGDLRRRTDLNVAASKRLLNDRLKLTMGNAFELEGPQTAVNNQNTLVPSNLAVDYSLSRDGRYATRVYRRNYDAGVLQGYISETGVNFIVNADYNRFKTVFKKRKPRQQPTNGTRSDTTQLNAGVTN